MKSDTMFVQDIDCYSEFFQSPARVRQVVSTDGILACSAMIDDLLPVR